ncbi:MAG: DUF2852 domain-containing protein [Hyphomicrobiaceae bacterium]|nr:DUF2852 domain-containing protein [Hyphomicrobiaceae bacterium]
MSTAIIKPQWSFVTITLMVLGFIMFWPLGLAMLAYIVWGEMFGGSAEKAEAFVNRQRENFRNHAQNRNRQNRYSSGNAAFDAYRQEQLKRLDEERRKLDQDVREFRDYMDNLAKARDREEFDRFMRDRRRNAGQYDQPFDQNENRQGY